MKKRSFVYSLLLSAAILIPSVASAQQTTNPAARSDQTPASGLQTQQSNVPPEAKQAQAAVERTFKRFRMGIEGGVGLDPELVMVGAHGTFAPIFSRNVEFRPGFELGFGEVTTLFGINLDVVYVLAGTVAGGRWTPYFGAGPNFALSHRGFETDLETEQETGDRFDFSDTDFAGGFNFIAGARNPNGTFVEMKATAYSVSVIRLLFGFTF